MCRRTSALLLFLPAILLAACATTPVDPSRRAELFLPGIVSTDDINVRVTFSPDGKRMLWGVISREAPNGFEIVESLNEDAGWGTPHAVPFNSPENDFDPSFAPDGSGVYFFSNRPGGYGKDDLYFAPFDAASGTYGAAQNLGAAVNSSGDVWAPVVSPDGQRLLFSTDGLGGAGKHDLYVARRSGSTWSDPENLESINGPGEDFDAAFLPDGKSIVFTSGDFEGAIQLFIARSDGDRYAPRAVLGPEINFAEAWTLGPSNRASERGVLYFTSHRKGDPERSNVYRICFDLLSDCSSEADIQARAQSQLAEVRSLAEEGTLSTTSELAIDR
jgi:Tol biopolymer transport system component